MTNYVHLTFEDQLQKFIERKMSPPKESAKAIQAIKTLNLAMLKKIVVE